MSNKYTIPGPPIALKRPRLNGKVLYDSQVSEKHGCGIFLKLEHGNKPLYQGPLRITLTFFMKAPKRSTNKWHTNVPDLDNMIKFYLDVCNGVLYEDDKQVSNIIAIKTYDLEPRTEIIIEELM